MTDFDAYLKNSPFAKELSAALNSAKEAGSILRNHFGNAIKSDNKLVDGQTLGLVTQADLESEQSIVKTLSAAFPSDTILGEESGLNCETQTDRIWVVDPLDGTNNFACGVPHFAISIALWENARPKLGVIHNPMTDDLFVCSAGEGAWHNTQRVSVNKNNELNQCLVGTGFYYDRGEMMQATLRSIEMIFQQNVLGIRRFGAAALDLAWVGTGRYGAFFEFQLAPWDFAAGMLLVQEAGGQVTTCSNLPLDLVKSSVLASNGYLHPQLHEIVSRFWNR
ncbi:MAG: inositol monophosphatase family protein [Pirellulaceae bacterium]